MNLHGLSANISGYEVLNENFRCEKLSTNYFESFMVSISTFKLCYKDILPNTLFTTI